MDLLSSGLQSLVSRWCKENPDDCQSSDAYYKFMDSKYGVHFRHDTLAKDLLRTIVPLVGCEMKLNDGSSDDQK